MSHARNAARVAGGVGRAVTMARFSNVNPGGSKWNIVEVSIIFGRVAPRACVAADSRLDSPSTPC